MKIRLWIKRMFLGLGSIVLVGLAGLAGYVAWHWTFFARLATYPSQTPVTSVAWYDPLETVPGGAGPPWPEPLTVPEPGALAPEAIARAVEYAEKKGSSALVVVHRGRIVAEHYWRGMTAGATTNSMSMAKTILALAIGAAVAEGKIGSLDDPAARYLPEWRGGGDRRAAITLRHLLQMHSGLIFNNDRSDADSDMLRIHFGLDMAPVVLGLPPGKEPGTTFDYVNANSQILGIIVERATGKRYAEYLSEVLWRPLGARDAAVWLDRPGGLARTYCCFFATPRDWARIGLLLLHRGEFAGRRILPSAWIDQMLAPSATEPDYGLHVWLGSPRGVRTPDRDEPFLADDLFYLDGMDKQRVYVIPSRDLVIVRVGEQARGWDEAALPNALIRGLDPSLPGSVRPSPAPSGGPGPGSNAPARPAQSRTAEAGSSHSK